MIASAKRPACLHETVAALAKQERPADEILLSVSEEEHCSPHTREIAAVRVVEGPSGLPCQRNTALLNLSSGTDLVLFLDDDVELRHDYIKNCVEFMEANPEVVALSGKLIGDGAFMHSSMSRQEARKMIQGHTTVDHTVRSQVGLMGSNMAVRANLAREILFDERMKLYASFEDLDFGIRCSYRGKVVFYYGCTAVHLAERSGRISRKRFGFAQVMNVYYLWRKGTLPHKRAAILFRNAILGNVKGLLIPYKGRTRADRLRQILGNLAAFAAIVRFGAVPERIERIG